MARVIARETYKMFMKKYSLQLMIKDKDKDNYKYKYKSIHQMSSEIYDHETFDEDIRRGLKGGLYYFTLKKV